MLNNYLILLLLLLQLVTVVKGELLLGDGTSFPTCSYFQKVKNFNITGTLVEIILKEDEEKRCSLVKNLKEWSSNELQTRSETKQEEIRTIMFLDFNNNPCSEVNYFSDVRAFQCMQDK